MDKAFRGQAPEIKSCLIHPTQKPSQVYRTKGDSAFAGIVFGLCHACEYSRRVIPDFSEHIDNTIKMRSEKLKTEMNKENDMKVNWEELFDPVELTKHQIDTVEEVRQKFKDMAEYLQHNLPSDGEAGRYRAIVKTKLEETAMVANKCISRTQEF